MHASFVGRGERELLVSKPVSIFSGRPPDRNRFRHPPFLRGNYFPRHYLRDNIFLGHPFTFLAPISAHALFVVPTFRLKMSKKPDIIDQARLSAYFAEMQEEFFEDKLRRIVSFQVAIFHNL